MIRLAVCGAALALVLAGCSGDGPTFGTPVAGANGNGLSSDATASGAAFASATDPAKPAASFSPFGDPPQATDGARQVIANPSVADVMAPSPLPEMSQGRTDAPVTIVQYASLTCPHCRNFHEKTYPALKREFIDTGKVRYILREFPIGKQSGNATIALRCARPEKYFDLYGRFMKEQASWVSQEVRLEPIFRVASKAGLTQAEWDACLKNNQLIEALKAIKDRGRTLGVIGTPNFFVNGKLVKRELSIDDVRGIVAAGGAVASATPASPR
jgi:protein-disulfide isomerase